MPEFALQAWEKAPPEMGVSTASLIFIGMVIAAIVFVAVAGSRRCVATSDALLGITLALVLSAGFTFFALLGLSFSRTFNPDTNPTCALENILSALTVLSIIALAATLLRRRIATPEEPLGIASSLALSAGGLALSIFFFAAQGWIGQAQLGVPILQWWNRPALLWVVIALAIARPCERPEQFQSKTPRTWLRILPALLFLAWVVAFDLLKCFEPQFDADALWYHLTLPYSWVMERGLRGHPAWLSQHVVQMQRTSVVAGYPLLTELLYTIPVSQAAPLAAKMIHLAFGVGVVAAIYGFLRGRGQTGCRPTPLTSAGALAFGATFFIFDSVNEIATWAHTDLARTFFLVCAAAQLAAYADSRRRRDLVVAAVIAGLAMSTHYLAIVFGNGLLTIAYVVAMWRSGAAARRIVGDLAVFWLVSISVFSPWPIKNFVLYGHPFYGIVNTSFRVPSLQIVERFFLGNVFLVGSVVLAVWMCVRRGSQSGERLIALYLPAYLLVGAFELPAITNMRFFFPVYAAGLMLAGRAAAPLFDRHRWVEVAFPVALFIIAIATTAYQWNQHLYDSALDFLLHNRPPASSIMWHQ